MIGGRGQADSAATSKTGDLDFVANTNDEGGRAATHTHTAREHEYIDYRCIVEASVDIETTKLEFGSFGAISAAFPAMEMLT